MLTRWTDLDQTFALLNDFQQRMNRVFDEFDGYRRPGLTVAPRSTWPPVNLFDNGDEVVLQALMPGLSEKEINVTANRDTLTISAERTAEVPEGYAVHRRERGSVRFSRSFSLPCPCDMERAAASVTNGVLTLRLAKAPEAKPRQISVTAK